MISWIICKVYRFCRLVSLNWRERSISRSPHCSCILFYQDPISPQFFPVSFFTRWNRSLIQRQAIIWYGYFFIEYDFLLFFGLFQEPATSLSCHIFKEFFLNLSKRRFPTIVLSLKYFSPFIKLFSWLNRWMNGCNTDFRP